MFYPFLLTSLAGLSTLLGTAGAIGMHYLNKKVKFDKYFDFIKLKFNLDDMNISKCNYLMYMSHFHQNKQFHFLQHVVNK